MRQQINKPRKYSTVEDGMKYQEISRIMTAAGMPMNHSCARMILFNALKKIFGAFKRRYSLNLSESQIDTIVNSAEFQSTISEILQACESRRKSNNPI